MYSLGGVYDAIARGDLGELEMLMQAAWANEQRATADSDPDMAAQWRMVAASAEIREFRIRDARRRAWLKNRR